MVQKEVQTSGQLLTTQKGLRQEQREGQPLPHVWDVLERKVKLLAPDGKGDPRRATQAYWKMVDDVSEQEGQLWEKGSDYDRAVLDLFAAITRPLPGTARTLTLEQFQHVRADFRELSVEEIAEQKRQLLQEMQQLRADVHQIFPQMDS